LRAKGRRQERAVRWPLREPGLRKHFAPEQGMACPGVFNETMGPPQGGAGTGVPARILGMLMRRIVVVLVVSWLASCATMFAVRAPERPMLPDFDKRLLLAPQADPQAALKQEGVATLHERLPTAKVDFDPLLGSPKFIHASDGFLSGPDGIGKGIPAEALQAFPADDPFRPVKAFIHANKGLFNHGAELIEAAEVRKNYVTAHNGLRTIVWEQQVDGIPVLERRLIAHITKNGELVSIASSFLPGLEQAANAGTPNRAEVQAAPTVSAAEAIVLAAPFMSEEVTLAELRATDPEPAGMIKHQRFAAAVLPGEIDVRLVWVPMTRTTVRLCWDVVAASKSRGEMFRVIVDAQSGDVVMRRNLTSYISDATYRVYTSDSPSPFSPGHPVPNVAQPPLIPRELLTLSALSIVASPDGWINDGDNETLGNNVQAHLDRDGDNQPDLPRPQGNPDRVFDFPLDLAQEPTDYGNASVVQLFYWNNWVHDKLYELGFNEAAGNFQTVNFGRGGLGNDAVRADSQDGSGVNNANFATPPDGIPPRMQMFVFDGPTPSRDSSLDAEVVIHEYIHGLSHRLVGGGVLIQALQTHGMGEGWSDFYSLAMLSEPGDDVDAVYPQGGYLSYRIAGLNFEQNYYFGIRRYPYTTDMSKNPLTFKDIDPTQASPHQGIPRNPISGPFTPQEASQVHNQGTVWCTVLWEARALLIKKHGFSAGNERILQLVTDGMKLGPANPNFVQARDGILLADQVNNAGEDFAELWAAFAKRGLGASATSPASTTTIGVVESYDLPGLSFRGFQVSDTRTGNASGGVDPNECNEIFVSLSNAGLNPANNILARLSTTTPGVTVVQAESAYPNLAPRGQANNLVPFQIYTAPNFACGAPINLVLDVTSSRGTNQFAFRVNTGLIGSAVRYHNNTPMPLPDLSTNTSTMSVSGFPGVLAKVTVSLHITHTFVGDLRIYLESPDGTRVALSRENGGLGNSYGASCTPTGARTTFDDFANLNITQGSSPFVGTFAPEEPLIAFSGKTAATVNGTWRLRIEDRWQFDSGTLQCWTLSLFPILCTEGLGPCGGDLAVTMTAEPEPVSADGLLTYSIDVSNLRPLPATDVRLETVLPPNTTLMGAIPSQGSCTFVAGTLVCSLGDMPAQTSAQVTVQVVPTQAGSLTNTVVLSSFSPDVNMANNVATVISTVLAPEPGIIPAGAVLIEESFSPPTGGIEPGETVTLNLALRNTGGRSTSNLVAVLRAEGGVVSPSGPQTYGVLAGRGEAVSRPFTFTADSINGGSVVATLDWTDGDLGQGTVTFNFSLGRVVTFANTDPIAIPTLGTANPYPSVIEVSDVPGSIAKLTVTLSKFSHSFPDDVDVLLVGPGGQSVILMSDAGGGNSIQNVTLTFDETAAAFLPDAGQITSGAYRPTNHEEQPDAFPFPAPSGPYGNSLTVFNHTEPNGTWGLYIVDDATGDAGTITGSWSLTFDTVKPVNPAANLSLTMTASPAMVLAGENLTYNMVVENHGPETATGVTITNAIPAGAQLISTTVSQGSISQIEELLYANLGIMASGARATVTIVISAAVPGAIFHTATVGGNEVDLNLANNTASTMTTIQNPSADLTVTLSGSPQPALVGSNIVYSITITNHGPDTAPAVVLTNLLPAKVTFNSVTTAQGDCTLVDGVLVCEFGRVATGEEVAVSVTVTPILDGAITNLVVVTTTGSDANLADNAASFISTVELPAPRIAAAGAVVVAESSIPANGAIDAGETVTLNLGLRNIGEINVANLTATIMNANGVTSLSAPVEFGVLLAGGNAVARPFTFQVDSAASGTLVLVLGLQDGGVDLGTVSFPFPLTAQASFGSSARITIPQAGAATPYPSVISVSNLLGVISKVTVSLENVTHSFPSDMDILLISPAGQKLLLMSDVGGSFSASGVTLNFDDNAAASLPAAAPLVSGTFKPTDHEPGDILPAPAPVGPYTSRLDVFSGSNPNGNWSLFVADDSGGDDGSIGGWSLNISTSQPLAPSADVSITLSGPDGSVFTGTTITYNLTVSNHGPAATTVIVTNQLPPEVALLSMTASQGSVAETAGRIIWDAGLLAIDSGATLTIKASVTSGAGLSITNTARAVAAVGDSFQANNFAARVNAIVSAGAAQLLARGFSKGQFELTLQGVPSRQYLIEASIDLQNWTPVSTNVLDGTSLIVDDPGSAGLQYRFYRAVSLD
jgi:uncharacterized repeat protein (TIGR01451 family)